MAAATYADQHSVRSDEADGSLDIAFRQAARDQRRTTIDTAVPDLPRFVVRLIRRTERTAANLRRESVDVGPAHLPDILVQRKVR